MSLDKGGNWHKYKKRASSKNIPKNLFTIKLNIANIHLRLDNSGSSSTMTCCVCYVTVARFVTFRADVIVTLITEGHQLRAGKSK